MFNLPMQNIQANLTHVFSALIRYLRKTCEQVHRKTGGELRSIETYVRIWIGGFGGGHPPEFLRSKVLQDYRLLCHYFSLYHEKQIPLGKWTALGSV